MAESSQPSSAVEYYLQELERCTFAADGGRKVVCFSLLAEWLHSTPPQDAVNDILSVNEATLSRGWIDLILHELFNGAAPIDLAGKLGEEGQCLRIFSILLKIGIGGQIQNLASLHDEDLPLQKDDLEYYLEGLGEEAGPKAAEFCAEQYSFLAKIFGSFQSLLRRFTAPIYSKEPMGDFGSHGNEDQASTTWPQLWKISVPEEFVVPKIRETLKGSSTVTISAEGIKLYGLALKSFKDERAFRMEKDVNRKLGDSDYVVRSFGEYAHDSPEGKTFNIIMQLPQTDLRSFFEHWPAERPMWPRRYHLFWSRLFDIARGVEFIHNHRGESGIHQDVRPENILLVEGRLKLAGLGLANFRQGPRTADNRFLFSGQANAWGAPETSIGPNALVKPEIDIWNLGCIFSVAATWIILGPYHVKVYEQLRLDAVNQAILRKSGSTLPRLPFFHDGGAQLPVIVQWHRYLRSMVRPNDHISPRILDLVETSMLQDSATRISATRLRNALDRILQAPYEKEVVKQPFSSKIEAAYARIALSDAHGPHGAHEDVDKGPLDDLVDTVEAMSNSSNYLASPGFAGLGEDSSAEQGSSLYDEDYGSNFASQRTSRRSDNSRSSIRRPPSANPWSSQRRTLNLSAAGQEIDREIPDGLEPVLQEDEQLLRVEQGYLSPSPTPTPLALGQQKSKWDYPSGESSVGSPPARPEIPTRSPQRNSRSPPQPEILTPPPQPDHGSPSPPSLQRRMSQASSVQTFSVPNHPTISDLRPKYEVDKGVHGRTWHTVRAGLNRNLNIRASKDETKDGVLDLNLTDDTDYELIVDDGPSSAEYWDQMSKVVETLATIFTVHEKARLGLSLAFGGRMLECSSSIDPKKFRKALEKNFKKIDAWASTDILATLERVFVPYRDLLQGSRQRPRDLNIIFLTDGDWAGAQAGEVAGKISGWVKELKVHYPGELNTGHFGIEVVQFGRDEQAKANLQRLAFDIQTRSGWDVVDTVPSLGSAYRAILGATKRHMRVDIASVDPPLSPPLTSPEPSLRSESRAASISGAMSPVSEAPSSRTKRESVTSQDGKWVIIRGGRTTRKVWMPAGSQPIP